MPQPYDYGSILASGQRLVPDLQRQMMEQQMLDIQAGHAETQRAATALRMAEAQREATEAQNFQRDLDAALVDGTPEAIQRLMLRYPEMAQGIKPAWEAMDERQRTADLTQIGTIYARGQAGDLAGAAAMLRQRVDADRAAGTPDPADEAVLAGLESDDPIQARAALATIGIQLAALTGDKFSETYGRLNPSEATPAIQREYDWRVTQFGKTEADRWLATHDESLVAVEPGGSIYRKSDFVGGGQPTQPGGGDQSTGASGNAIEQAALAAVPGAFVTSRQRSPERNRAVGGVENSYHLTDQARDFVPPRGMPMAQLAARLKRALPGFDVLNEGDHVHVEPKGGGGPVRVSSVQQANALAPGTRYVTPDGREFVR